MSNLSGATILMQAPSNHPVLSTQSLLVGIYKAIISASEIKPTRDGYGEYLSLTLQVIEGQYANRLVFARLNLKTPMTRLLILRVKTCNLPRCRRYVAKS